ncbi:MAG: toxin-antitoxin system protein [Armatimonadetes bacterium]|nr:toxin-antitoxin system protein [Armatimonadota bacterium]
MATTTRTARPAPSTTTVRISQSTHERLRNLAEETGLSLTATLDQAVECYRRKVFFDGLDAEYAALQADPVAWQEYLREREEWDATLRDDLEDDPWPTDA